MSAWKIELVTEYIICNNIEIEADAIEKVNYKTLLVDGVFWDLPEIPGLSFARVEIIIST